MQLRWANCIGDRETRTPMIYVTVGTGIGVSVILDGKIYRGVGQCHPEIGHQVLDPSGPVCTCGCAAVGRVWRAGRPWWLGWRKTLPRTIRGKISPRGEVCSRPGGDEWARRAVEQVGYYLGLGLANLVNIFAPQTIVLGGSVMKSAPLFVPRIHGVIRENCTLVPHDRLEVSLASLGPEVG